VRTVPEHRLPFLLGLNPASPPSYPPPAVEGCQSTVDHRNPTVRHERPSPPMSFRLSCRDSPSGAAPFDFSVVADALCHRGARGAPARALHASAIAPPCVSRARGCTVTAPSAHRAPGAGHLGLCRPPPGQLSGLGSLCPGAPFWPWATSSRRHSVVSLFIWI
jgi:hypothetical protein